MNSNFFITKLLYNNFEHIVEYFSFKLCCKREEIYALIFIILLILMLFVLNKQGGNIKNITKRNDD